VALFCATTSMECTQTMMWAYVATVYVSLYILLLLLQEFTQLNVTEQG